MNKKFLILGLGDDGLSTFTVLHSIIEGEQQLKDMLAENPILSGEGYRIYEVARELKPVLETLVRF